MIVNEHRRSLRPDDRVGGHVRRWRTRRGMSQLAVAVETGVSTPHLSFVETGRARPSKQLIVHLARFLEPTNQELNVCLLSAGHAPLHVVDLDAGRATTNATLDEMLNRHHPAPAFVFNADWMMERLNVSGQWLCSVLMPDLWNSVVDPGRGLDMIAALIHTDGLLSRLRQAPQVGAAMLRQLRVEQLTNPHLTERVDVLEQSVRTRFPQYDLDAEPDFAEPSFNHIFDTTHGPLAFFTTQSVVGIPQHVTVGTPRVELWFPSDARTRSTLSHHVKPLDVDRRTRRVTLAEHEVSAGTPTRDRREAPGSGTTSQTEWCQPQ